MALISNYIHMAILAQLVYSLSFGMDEYFCTTENCGYNHLAMLQSQINLISYQSRDQPVWKK